MDFPASRRYLLGLGHETGAMKLGLENTRLLLTRLGRPQDAFRKIQIAGTNGKGSTAAMLTSICRAAEIRTGLYTSPHLVSLAERVRFADAGRDEEVGEDEFARAASLVRDAAEAVAAETGARPTFFEQVTALALVAFRERGVELAILETGLGGRLDAVTAAEAEVVAFTPVSLDHQEYLGSTVAQIAAEKAAVIHEGCRVAVTAPQDAEAREAIERQARACGIELREAAGAVEELGSSDTGRLRVTLRTTRAIYGDVRLALRGRHQIGNALVAVHLAEALAELDPRITTDAIRRGLERAVHPGRLELVERNGAAPILLDGAHNEAGALALAEFVREFVPAPITLVFGAMRDKDLAAIAGVLFPLAARVVLTRPENTRAARPAALADLAPHAAEASGIRDVRRFERAADALAHARRVTPPDGFILVTGSLYLVGEIKTLLRGGSSEAGA